MSPFAHALARLLSRLPLIYNVIIFIWIESAVLFIFGIVMIIAGLTFGSGSIIWGLFIITTVVLNLLLIRQTQDLTVDFYVSRDWKPSRKAMFREREPGDTNVPDFGRLKRFCLATILFTVLLAGIFIVSIWASNITETTRGIEKAVGYTFLVLVLLCLHLFYTGWTWYTMHFIVKYEPPKRPHHQVQ
ncbi:MAG TPA: hypothetical protein VI112_07225 [Bacteroidia bacterium]|jgi:hypothetical protein